MPPRVRALVFVVAITIALIAGAGARPAAAAPGDPGGGSLVGFGFGPRATVGGELGDLFTSDGASGRIRLGGRVGRLGYEIDTVFVALDGGGLEQAGLVMGMPVLGYHLIAHPHVQLALRGGLGYGSISGDVTGPAPPCRDEPPCPGPTVETIRHAAFGVDVGGTFQIALGRRRGGRAVLWVDAGLSLLRVRIDDENVGGTVATLTFGIAHGMEF